MSQQTKWSQFGTLVTVFFFFLGFCSSQQRHFNTRIPKGI